MRSASKSEMAALSRAARALGSQADMARQLGFATRACVQPWFSNTRLVPPEYCVHIERLTGELGAAVSCEQLRTDVVWARIVDATWPFHAQGRPAVDLARMPLPVTAHATAVGRTAGARRKADRPPAAIRSTARAPIAR